MSAALAVAAGIAIGLFGFLVVRQVRRRRVATPA
jgi:hypothetical protein